MHCRRVQTAPTSRQTTGRTVYFVPSLELSTVEGGLESLKGAGSTEMWVGLSRASGSTVNTVDLSDRLRKFWHDGLVPGSQAAYVLAVGCVAVASLVRYALG